MDVPSLIAGGWCESERVWVRDAESWCPLTRKPLPADDQFAAGTCRYYERLARQNSAETRLLMGVRRIHFLDSC